MKTDLDIALEFIAMLKSKGFKTSIHDFDGRTPDEEGFDKEMIALELLDDEDTVFVDFSFIGSKFYRISGYTAFNQWRDEIDWKKYC